MPHTPYLPGQAPETVDAGNAAKAQALRIAARLGLLGLTVGGGTAALLGLPQILKKQPIPSYPLQTEVELAYPQEVAKKADAALANTLLAAPAATAVGGYFGQRRSEKPKAGMLHGALKQLLATLPTLPAVYLGGRAGGALGRKLTGRYPRLGWRMPSVLGEAQEMIPGMTSALGSAVASAPIYAAAAPVAENLTNRMIGEAPEKRADWADSIVGATIGGTPGATTPVTGSPRWARGDTQTKPMSIPWALPAAGAAGVGGVIGGHQLVQYLLRKKRKADLDLDLQSAQKEYDEAMLSQYDPTKLRHLSAAKEASAASTASAALDYCFDVLTKQGMDLDATLGLGAGAYGTAALAGGTLSALGAYRWLRGRSQDKLLRDALKRRATLRSLQNPPDVYVRPVPVEYTEKSDK